MPLSKIKDSGMVLLGCGKMGQALLQGWLNAGIPAESIWVIDPFPSKALAETGIRLNAELPDNPAVYVIAVKPQILAGALTESKQSSGLYLSVAAGTPLEKIEEIVGMGSPVIRVMPNTPAAIGRGISAIVGNSHATDAHINTATALMQAVGQTVLLDSEGQMDAVTGVSGSGPAFVFHMIESLAAAGRAEGLPDEMAMTLAKATVGGAGALAEQATETPAKLRENVTSPAGTTEAGLAVLMKKTNGLAQLMRRTVAAAAARSRALRK